MKNYINHYEILYAALDQPKIIRLWGTTATDIMLAGQLVFVADAAALPADGIIALTIHGHDNEWHYSGPQLHYRLRDFGHIVDLLRNETPVAVLFDEPHYSNGLRVIWEKLGEAEV